MKQEVWQVQSLMKVWVAIYKAQESHACIYNTPEANYRLSVWFLNCQNLDLKHISIAIINLMNILKGTNIMHNR